MTFGDNSQSKTIRGLSFKNILEEKKEPDSSNRIPQNSSFFKKVLWFLKRILLKFSEKILFFTFSVEFLRYVLIRGRVILAILTAASDLFSVYFDSTKHVFVNKLFWGRGKLLRFMAQFLVFFLLLFTLISYTYKTATIDSAEHNFQNVYAAQQDLLIQAASTNTQAPKDRGRMTSEKYIVKAGDSLGSIAEYYGLDLDTVLWANDLGANSVIKPGEELDIPPGNGLNIVVQSGDNLEVLAKKYESNPQMIIDVNWLDYPFELQAGQELFVPDGRKPEPPKPAAPVYSGIIRQRPGQLSSSAVVEGVGRFLQWPVAGGGRLTQCYSGWHNGVDIASGTGTNIISSAAGTVTFAGCQSACPPLGALYGGWGLAWTVVVDHGNGFSSSYSHLKNIYVSSGESVSSGQALGEMGATGTAYGVHIHFMLLRGGGGWNTHVNPAMYMVNSICGY